MKISTFTIIKNEAEYIGYGIMSVLDCVDEMVFADGNSTDGTVEIIEDIQRVYDKNKKIKLFKNKDCKNLTTDYVRLFNWTMQQCTGDYIWFLHPDMICANPEVIRPAIDGMYYRYSVKMVSIAGENRDLIIDGRTTRWPTIFINKFGIHFYGWYGSMEEDFYFADITGDEHKPVMIYPPSYRIIDTEIQLYHYCETKSYARRFDRMVKTLMLNSPISKEMAQEIAKNHPRVTLQTGTYGEVDLVFNKFTDKHPAVFKQYDFSKFKKG